jgi:hypothetical protein
MFSELAFSPACVRGPLFAGGQGLAQFDTVELV